MEPDTDLASWATPWPLHSGSPVACEACGSIGAHIVGCLSAKTAELPAGAGIDAIIKMPSAVKYAIQQCGLSELADLNTITSELCHGSTGWTKRICPTPRTSPSR
jgi:hypothetical protein